MPPLLEPLPIYRRSSESELASRMGQMTQKPRSIVLDLFGDYLRYVSDGIRLKQITSLLGIFDVPPATVRVTMSRLRREGWFTTRTIGRESVYHLTPRMVEILDEGRARIFAEPTMDWTGHWTMVIYQMTESERQERDGLRKMLAWHGFGPLSTSTWLAPGDRRAEAREFVNALTSSHQVDVLLCSSESLHHDRELARRCWALDQLEKDYQTFIRSNRRLPRMVDRVTGAEAVIVRTRLIWEYRHFPFRDPRLPVELRPKPWHGIEAYALFRRAHAMLGEAARTHVSVVIGGEIGPLPHV